MRILFNDGRPVSDRASVVYAHCTVDLTAGAIAFTDIPCRNLEVVLGGFSQSFQILATRDITDALSPANPLVVDTSALTSTNVMTGLRTHFSAYSPLKMSNKGLPAAIWSAGIGKFGSKLKRVSVDEIIFEGKAVQATLLVIRESPTGPTATLEPADDLLGPLLLQEDPRAVQAPSRWPFRCDRSRRGALRGLLLLSRGAEHEEPPQDRRRQVPLGRTWGNGLGDGIEEPDRDRRRGKRPGRQANADDAFRLPERWMACATARAHPESDGSFRRSGPK